MTECLICSKESENPVCERCLPKTDLQQLCEKIAEYNPGHGDNPLWEKAAGKLEMPWENFRHVIFAIADFMPTPQKEYYKILAFTGKAINIGKDYRPWFGAVFDSICDNEALEKKKLARLQGMALDIYIYTYEYEKAEAIAEALADNSSKPWQAYYNMIKYYNITRRYDRATALGTEALTKFSGNESVCRTLKALLNGINPEGRGYSPAPKENRKEAQRKYADFMQSIGIPVVSDKEPVGIPREEYPEFKETTDTSFNSFVAFDLETTGLADFDEITQIGAVYVENGSITKRFETLVAKDTKKITPEIEALTGLNDDMRKGAPCYAKALADFKEFCGDAVLVGFNNISLDNRFLSRFGRKSSIVFHNRFFDVLPYAAGVQGKKQKLEELCRDLDIKIIRAHHALDDAEATALAFLALKQKENPTATSLPEEFDF